MWYKGVRWYHVECDILKEGPRTKHSGRWGIVEYQIPSIKVLFKTNTKSHKHPIIRPLCRCCFWFCSRHIRVLKEGPGTKHPGRWGIVDYQIPSIKVLFKTNAKSHKHPSIRPLCRRCFWFCSQHIWVCFKYVSSSIFYSIHFLNQRWYVCYQRN